MTLGAITDFFSEHLNWFLFAAAVVAGLAVGYGDLLRLNLKRIWAISGVCFDESIRRRILWITPLAIIGVIIVAQLQRPIDEQDAIRQTTKFCLFATGFIVAVTTIILACTNLPREIESRVIYTVVTKPTTRLEIVIGKVIGFARVSLAILVIMGLFTYGYLWVRAWNMQRYIAARLTSEASPASMTTLQHYKTVGLLSAKKLEQPDGLEIFARDPQPGYEQGKGRQYFAGGGEGNVELAFQPTRDQLIAGNDPSGEPAAEGVVVEALVGYEKQVKPGSAASAAAPPPTTIAAAAAATHTSTTGPSSRPYYGPFIISPEKRAEIMTGVHQTSNPVVSMELFDANDNFLGPIKPLIPGSTFELTEKNQLNLIRGVMPPDLAAKMLKGRTYVRINGNSPDTDYFIEGPFVRMLIAGATPDQPKQIPPAPDARPIFQSRTGTFGLQLRGGNPQVSPVGVYEFRNARVDTSETGEGAPFELRVGVERSGVDNVEDSDDPTRLAIRVVNRADGTTSPEVLVEPESNRANFFNLPAASMSGGNFDVLIRCLTPGHYVGLQHSSLAMVTDRQTFAWNLAKSLLILWLLAVLITTVAIFTSTFLSWPIAVILTMVILLGHWGVLQLGDAAAPGLGPQVATEMGLRSAPTAKAVSATVEKLNWLLQATSAVLPDISQFSALEDIERGVAIPSARLADAAAVTFGFGLPLVLLAYVFLKNKEVAP